MPSEQEPPPGLEPDPQRAARRREHWPPLPTTIDGLWPWMRGLGLHRKDGPVGKGLGHTVLWSNAAAALVAVSSDIVKPAFEHCPYTVGIGSLLAFLGLLVARRYWLAASEVVSHGIVFCVTTALLSALVIGLESRFGGEHGSITERIPGIEELQKQLGFVKTEIDAIYQFELQDAAQREARAEARHAEEMEGQKAQNGAMRALAEAVSRGKGVPIAALLQILARLGETVLSNDPAEVERKLAQKADEYLVLRQQVLLLSGDDPHVRALQHEAEIALGNSDFVLARAKLLEAADIERAASLVLADHAKTRALAATKLLEGSAHVATITLHYRVAANDLGKAVELAAPFDRYKTWQLMMEQAAALQSQGDEFGDNATLAEAVGLYKRALQVVSHTDEATSWAATQNNIGTALSTLGERETGTAHLEEAVAAYRAALSERTRGRMPLDWAATQNNLGVALEALGERETGAAHLEEAAAAYRAALAERTRERVPFDWAATQNNLGTALWQLGERESGTAHLEEAVAAYRAALMQRTRERVPLDWAATQNNLGTALTTLGERENGTAHLEEAVAAYRTALAERTRERVPLDWAATQNNLGAVLRMLGERENGTAHLGEAVAAYHAALAERTRERVPLDWAATQNNLGTALSTLGERENGTAHLEEAVAAYHAALAERTRERVPLGWAMTQNNLGITLQKLGERESGTAHLEEAVAAYHAALAERTRERVPLDWAKTQNELGTAFSTLGERESGTAYLEEAVAAFDAALTVFMVAQVDYYTGTCRANRDRALALLTERKG